MNTDIISNKSLIAYRDYFKLIPWKIFGTFTFPFKADDQQAETAFCTFIGMHERYLHSPIIWIRGDEKRQAGLGTSFSGRHLHFLLASPAALNASALEYSWKSLYGGNIGIDTSNGISIANVGHALVQAYNPAHENQLNEYGKPMGGIAYILKCMVIVNVN
jgi:hypothetical protein